MRKVSLLWWTLLASCNHPPASSRVESLRVVPASTPPVSPCDRITSPCDRIKERQRVGSHAFRRCIWTEDGAIGVVAEPDAKAFRIVFEPQSGEPVSSAPLGSTNAQVEDVVVLPPPPGRSMPVAFAKYSDRIQPAPLGQPLPVQTCQFFASVFDAADASGACVWTGLEEVGSKQYRLSFRFADLRWDEGVAYGGRVERSLPGAAAHVFLGERYEVGSERDLPLAIAESCRETPTLDWAKPDELWAAAQCHRVRGEPVAAVLKLVENRCGALARQSLPSLRALSELRRRERDGLAVARRDIVLASEKLAATDPPSACFSADHLWNVDYTARTHPFELPKVVLESAWKEGLDAMGAWPR